MESAVPAGVASAIHELTRHGFRQAVVHDGGVATSYAVRGAGSTVVVLAGPGEAEVEAWLWLSERARVIVPDAGEAALPGRAFSAWLRGFLEGLGIGEVALIALPSYALAALAFALIESARVLRLVLLQRDAEDVAAPACSIREELVHAAQPLLVVRLDDAAPVMSDAVFDFLTSGSARAG